MTYQLFPTGYTAQPPRALPGASRFALSLDLPNGALQIGSNAWPLMDEHHLVPPPRAVELYRLAVLVYTADTRILRQHAFNGWERDIQLHVPVSNPAPWIAAREIITDLLSFLTGDHWRLEFFRSAHARPLRDAKRWKKGKKPKADTVALFSGGLDSLIGASDLLANGVNAMLIGHCDAPSTSAVQSKLAEALAAKYSVAAPLLQFWIKPPQLIGREKEETTRGRSFLFFTLATLAASGLGRPARLVIPENGFIALNAPLTSTRLGPLSTRTVHPYTVGRYRELLAALKLPVTVETPYALTTKGEMLERAKDQPFLRSRGPTSMSCAHPTAGRWQKLDPFKHCGRCVPCLIRRASFHRVGWDKASAYHTDVLSASRGDPNLEDLRAFLLAVERRHTVPPEVAVLRSGPIPQAAGSIAEYADVYSRGLDEVATFLKGRKTRRL